MKKFVVLSMSLCAAFAITSCKSSESAYKKAYEKAKLQEMQATTPAEVETSTEVVPVQTVTPTTPVKQDNTPVRRENVELISGTGLKAYSVICGSFSLKANAEGLQNTLKGKGYAAQVVYNSSNRMYRVAATTSDDKSVAVQARNQLRSDYPDAWLLHTSK